MLRGLAVGRRRLHLKGMSRSCSAEEVAALALDLAQRECGRLGLLLDYDGTITPTVPHPADARLSPDVATLLASLSRRPGIDLGVITGRSLETLLQVAGGLPGIDLSVNGGLRIVTHEGEWTHPEAAGRRHALATIARELEAFVAGHAGTELEDKGLTLALHHRNAPDREHESRQAARRAAASQSGHFRIIEGKAVFEIQPAIDWDKGRALEELCRRWHVDRAIVFFGDDTIDEPGFEAAMRRGGLSVRVGNGRPTGACCELADVAEAIRCLRLIDATWDQRFDFDRG